MRSAVSCQLSAISRLRLENFFLIAGSIQYSLPYKQIEKINRSLKRWLKFFFIQAIV